MARLAALVLLWACGQLAHAQQASEAAVKAAFLYKFAGYVEWPSTAFAAADSPLVIGVLGSDEVAAELERLVASRTVANRRVQIRRLKEGEDLRGLHVLYVGRAQARPPSRAALLVVTDGEKGLESGSAISFVPVEDRVGFEVSLEAAERAGLRISARMLGVARRVVRG